MNPPLDARRLGRRFFARDPRLVAADLIGHGLLRCVAGDWMGGVIVETEAYLSENDPASHSRAGPTRRCQSMFCEPGTLYVYSIHAKYCLNVVTEKKDVGSAVLIRAIEPRWGIDAMSRHRGQSDPRRLTRGPAMLCQSLAITTRDDGIDLVESPDVFLVRTRRRRQEVGVGPRIGVSAGHDLPLRFFQRGNRFVSGSRRHRD